MGQPRPQIFPKIDWKTNNVNKKCTRTCKKDVGPAGPKVDATVTEQNVDATVNPKTLPFLIVKLQAKGLIIFADHSIRNVC